MEKLLAPCHHTLHKWTTCSSWGKSNLHAHFALILWPRENFCRTVSRFAIYLYIPNICEWRRRSVHKRWWDKQNMFCNVFIHCSLTTWLLLQVTAEGQCCQVQKPNHSSLVAELVCPSNHVSPQISLWTPFQLSGGKRYLSNRNCMEKLISAVGQTNQLPWISFYSLKRSLQANICVPDVQHLLQKECHSKFWNSCSWFQIFLTSRSALS